MKRTIKYIIYREVEGSSNRSFKTIKEAQLYAKKMNIVDYSVKECIEITR